MFSANVMALAAPVSRPRIWRRLLVPSLNTEAVTRRPVALIFVAMSESVSVEATVTVLVVPPSVMSKDPDCPSAPEPNVAE